MLVKKIVITTNLMSLYLITNVCGMDLKVKKLKQKLRREISSRISQMNPEEIQRQSTIIQKTVCQLPEFIDAKRVGLYLSIPGKEVDTLPLLKKCFELGKHCFVPRYTPNSTLMQLVQIYSYEDYESMPIEPKYGIKQPDLNDHSRAEALQTGGVDILLVPGVAFTRTGLRLGHGKGYYDRWLAKCNNAKNSNIRKPPVTVGLTLCEQVVEDLPVDVHDVPIDHVIYPCK